MNQNENTTQERDEEEAKCRFTLTNAMGAQCETHGRMCPRYRYEEQEPWTIPQESSK